MQRFLLALLCLAFLPAAWAGAADVSVPMHALQLGPHSYFVQGLPGAASSENQGFMSNGGFVVTADGVVVFDALATPPLAEKLLGVIRRVTQKPIKRVIVSHYHADRFYGSRAWIASLDKRLALDPKVLIPGHGEPSHAPRADLQFTREYLAFLREQMGRAARDLVPFDEAYEAVDWSKYRNLPAFEEPNRANAYNQYLRLEQEGGN